MESRRARERKQEEKGERLHAQRQELEKAIPLTRAAKSTNKAPPPPAPWNKAPPKIDQPHQKETPPKSPQRSAQLDESSDSSGEEERENVVEGPIDLANPEQLTGPHIRMKLSISELKGALERNRYIEKQRRSETCKIICDKAKLGRIIAQMAKEPPNRRYAT